MLKKQVNRIRRHKRIRARVIGTAKRPRLSVFRSHQHTHLQLIDDEAGKTVAQASTLETAKIKGKGAGAAAVAKLLVERAHKLGIKEAVFDRGGYKYHGRVKAVTEAAREAGLKI
jgi:large subunit ribosomal protein L18